MTLWVSVSCAVEIENSDHRFSGSWMTENAEPQLLFNSLVSIVMNPEPKHQTV